MMDIDLYKIKKIAIEAGRLILKYYGAEYDIYTLKHENFIAYSHGVS